MREKTGDLQLKIISTRTVVSTALLLIASLILGYLSGSFAGSTVMEQLAETFGPIAELSAWQLMLVILANNGLKFFLAMVLGVTLIAPFLFVVINGIVVGIVVHDVVASQSLGYVLAAILPHGVIEIPVLVISTTMGFKIGGEVWRKIGGRESKIKTVLVVSMKLYVKKFLPAITVAAFIEAFVTPMVVGLVVG